MNDAVGTLRTRVRLESPLRVADEIGGVAILWADEGDVWAAIAGGGASESGAFDGARSTAGYRVMINRRDDVRAGWRLVWGERRLRVVGVADEGAPRIDLSCEEETF